MESITIIVVVGITLNFIGLFVYAFIFERKRREGLEKTSLEMYKPDIHVNPEDMYEFFQKAVTITNLFRELTV